jgi:hypothetical protein
MRLRIALYSVAAACVLSSILFVGEVLYRRQFREALEQLLREAGQAHQPEHLGYGYSRYSSFMAEPKISLTEDLFEAARMRVPRWLGLGSRLSPHTAEATAYAYVSLDVSHDISGEFRTFHTFIWSPRERRFDLWLGECRGPGCPGNGGRN